MNLTRVQRIEIEAIARQYIDGRLSEDEEAQFEMRMIRDRRIAQEVEITRRMRDGLLHLQRTGALDLKTPPRRAFWPRVQLACAADIVMDLVTRPRSALRPCLQLAAAAAIVIVLGATALYYVSPAHPSNILAASAHALPGFDGTLAPMSYVLAERRTIDDGLVIPKSDPRRIVQLNILPARPDAGGPYRIELRHAEAAAGSEPLARIEVGSAVQGLVPVFLNISKLTAGRYVLTVIEPETSVRSPATTRHTFTVDTDHRGPSRPDE